MAAGRRALLVEVDGKGAAASAVALASVTNNSASSGNPSNASEIDWQDGIHLQFSTLAFSTLDLPNSTWNASASDNNLRALDASGYTLFRIRGGGFDQTDCGANNVSIGGVPVGVVDCAGDELLVIYPRDTSGGPARNASVDIQVGTYGFGCMRRIAMHTR